MVACALAAFAASVYLVITLEILKLRTRRFRELLRDPRRTPPEEAFDQGVARELETGSFAAVDPETASSRASTRTREQSP